MIANQDLRQSPYFDISDFKGISKYKLLPPLLYIASWILMFTGPYLFPVQFQRYEIFILAYVTFKLLASLFIAIYATSKAMKSLKTQENRQNGVEYQDLNEINDEIMHAFIIPSYKESIELMSETLEVLAAHKKAKSNYLIILAMEAHEKDCEQKAYQLIQSFRLYFRVIDFTKHVLRKYEQKGKAANVSWCVEHIEPILEKNLIKPESVMLTIMDCDSWAPELYIAQLEKSLRNQYEEKDQRIYQPIQIFTRNHEQVPFITRIIDNFHSFAYFSTHFSCLDITFSLSNYSLSYTLAKNINFWDTCPDAIGEDFHTFSKAFWKTDGAVKGRPIYVPFNQISLHTGEGYCEDVKARFWQVERHARGVIEVAYALKMFFNNPFRLKNLYFLLVVVQIFSFMILVPWVAVSFNFSKLLIHIYKPSPQLYTEQFMGYFITAFSLVGTIAYILFDITKRRANRILYKQENESLLRLLEYMLFFMITFALFVIPAFVIASFGVLFGAQEYKVAKKQISGGNKNGKA